jgi:uncharacterized membrane protein
VTTRFGKPMTKPLSLPRRLAAPASLTAAMVLTGANVVLGKAVVAEVPVYLFMLFRFLVSTAALLALVHGEPGPKLRQMQRGQARDLTFMALLGMIGFTALLFEGLKRTSASEAGIITATLPAVVALLGVAVLRERLTIAQAGAVGLAVAGLLLVAAGAERRTTSLFGNLLVAARLSARPASLSSASGWRRPISRCDWRSAPIWSGWPAPLRSRCSNCRSTSVRSQDRPGCLRPGMRSLPACSVFGSGIAACHTSRHGLRV